MILLVLVVGIITCALYFFIKTFSSLPRKKNKSCSIPRIQGWLPGNMDILWKLVSCESREQCGETLRQWTEQYGPTYDMNLLWGHQVV